MTICAKKAILLVIANKVHTLEKYEELIHSMYFQMYLPSVIRLKIYINLKRKEISLSRKNIFLRDEYTCQYCNRSSVNMTLDHIIPKQSGGEESWENLVTACYKCNSKKGNKMLKEVDMILLSVPRKPNYFMSLQKYVKNNKVNWGPYLFMKGNNER